MKDASLYNSARDYLSCIFCNPGQTIPLRTRTALLGHVIYSGREEIIGGTSNLISRSLLQSSVASARRITRWILPDQIKVDNNPLVTIGSSTPGRGEGAALRVWPAAMKTITHGEMFSYSPWLIGGDHSAEISAIT